jgi:hypothetical protein
MNSQPDLTKESEPVISKITGKSPKMKIKTLPKRPQSEKDSDSDSSIGIEIEEHTPPAKKSGFFASVIDNAKESLADLAPDDDPQPVKRGRGRPRKEAAVEPVDMQQDFTNMLAGVLALVVTAVNLPPEVQPDSDELKGVSYYAVRILIRHFPINNAMSADALDTLGILSILSAWYMRVAPFLIKTSKKPKQQKAPQAPEPIEQSESIPFSGDLNTELFLQTAIKNRAS